jgi:hypothetical protein
MQLELSQLECCALSHGGMCSVGRCRDPTTNEVPNVSHVVLCACVECVLRFRETRQDRLKIWRQRKLSFVVAAREWVTDVGSELGLDHLQSPEVSARLAGGAG